MPTDNAVATPPMMALPGAYDEASWAYVQTLLAERAELVEALRTMVEAARRQPGNGSLQGLCDGYEPLLRAMGEKT